MASKATTVKEYLDELPEDRRAMIEALRKVIRANLDKAFEEGIQYGMIGYYLPHSRYPAGYHCDPKQPLPFASLGSTKGHVGIYMFCIYGNDGEEAQFRKEWVATGKRLDMGKACVRVKKLEDIPLDVVGRAFKRMTAGKFVAHYEGALAGRAKPAKKARTKKAPTKKASAKKAAPAKKPPTKKAAPKKVATKKVAAKKVATKKVTAKKRTAKKSARR